MSDENNSPENDSEKMGLQEDLEVMKEALLQPPLEIEPATIQGGAISLAQGEGAIMTQIDESSVDMIRQRIVASNDEVQVSDVIMMFADEAMRQTEDEIARRVRYYKQIRSLVQDNARFIMALTLMAERLGVEIEIDGVKQMVRSTKVPNAYSPNSFNHIFAHVSTRINRLLASVEADAARIRDLEESKIQLTADKTKMAEATSQNIAAAVSPLKDTIERLTARNATLLEEMQKSIDPKKAVFILALRDVDGKALVVCLRDKDGEEVPALTKNIMDAHTFEDEESAHSFRVRIIRAVRSKELRFSKGLDVAKKLQIAHLEINLDD